MNEGDIVYFIHEKDLYIGKIIRQIEKDQFKVLTYTTRETHLELSRNELYSSITEGDQNFQKAYPKVELDIDKLMDTARFLERA